MKEKDKFIQTRVKCIRSWKISDVYKTFIEGYFIGSLTAYEDLIRKDIEKELNDKLFVENVDFVECDKDKILKIVRGEK
jgi:hypothetical protein